MPNVNETYRLIEVPENGNCGPRALAESVVALIQNTNYEIPVDVYNNIVNAFKAFLTDKSHGDFEGRMLSDMGYDGTWGEYKKQQAKIALSYAKNLFISTAIDRDAFQYQLRSKGQTFDTHKHAFCIILAIGLRKLGVEKAIEAVKKINGNNVDTQITELQTQLTNGASVSDDILKEAAILLNLGLQINDNNMSRQVVDGDGKAGTIVVQYTENPKHFNPLILSSFVIGHKVSSAVATSSVVSAPVASESKLRAVGPNLRKVAHGGRMPKTTPTGIYSTHRVTGVNGGESSTMTPPPTAAIAAPAAVVPAYFAQHQYPLTPTTASQSPVDVAASNGGTPVTGLGASSNSSFAYPPTRTLSFNDAFNQLITALKRAGFSYNLVNISGISRGSIAQYPNGFYNITGYSEAVGRCLFEPLNIATTDTAKNQTLNILRHIFLGMQYTSINGNNESILSNEPTTLSIISEIVQSIDGHEPINLSSDILQQLYCIGLSLKIHNLQNTINSFTTDKKYIAFIEKLSGKCNQLAQNLADLDTQLSPNNFSEQQLSIIDENFSKISLEYQEICKKILQELQQNVPNQQYNKLQERLNSCKTEIDQLPGYVKGKPDIIAEYQKLIQQYENVGKLNKHFEKHVNQGNGQNEDMVWGQLVSVAVDDLLKIQSQLLSIEASLEKLEQELKPVPRVGASPADDNDIQSTHLPDHSTTTHKRKELEPVVNPANAPSALFNQGSTKADAEKPAFTISPASQQKQDSTEDSAAKRQKTGEKDTVKDHTDKIWTKEKYTTALGKLSKMAGSGDINISKNTKAVDEIIAESTGESLNFELAVKGTALKKSTCTLSPDGSVKLKNANFANSASNDQKQTGYKNLLQVFKEFPGNASEKAVIEINDMPLADVELLLIAAKNIKLDLANVTVPNVEFAEALKQAITEHHLDYSPNIIRVKQEPIAAVQEGERQTPKYV